MHILIISTEDVWASGNKLLGIFQLQQAKALKEKGFKVNILSPSVISLREILQINDYTYRSNSFCMEGIQVYKYQEINFALKSNVGFMKAWIRAGIKLFNKYIKVNGVPEIIHAHNFLYADLASILNDKFRIPYVVTEHSSRYTMNIALEDKLKSEVKNAFLKSSKNIFVSNYLKNSFYDYFEIKSDFKSIIIHNLLSRDFEANKVLKINDTNSFTFINVASLIPVKNQISIINAFYSVFKNNPNVYLKIVGAGILMDNLKKYVLELGLDTQIVFTGQLETKNVIEEMLKSNCFILSSVKETFGVVVIEAMALGLPILTSNCGGTEEIVSDSFLGIVYDQYDQHDLQTKMLFMYEKRKDFKSDDIINYTHSQFGSSHVAQKIISVYMQIT